MALNMSMKDKKNSLQNQIAILEAIEEYKEVEYKFEECDVSTKASLYHITMICQNDTWSNNGLPISVTMIPSGQLDFYQKILALGESLPSFHVFHNRLMVVKIGEHYHVFHVKNDCKEICTYLNIQYGNSKLFIPIVRISELLRHVDKFSKLEPSTKIKDNIKATLDFVKAWVKENKEHTDKTIVITNYPVDIDVQKCYTDLKNVRIYDDKVFFTCFADYFDITKMKTYVLKASDEKWKKVFAQM